MRIPKIENIKTRFPDNFGIKDSLRNNRIQNPEFLELTLNSYDILASLKEQSLSISEYLKRNNSISIFDHQIFAAEKVKNKLGGTAMLADEVGLGKTIEAGILIKEFLTTKLATKVLVLTPPSLLLQWQDELASKFNMDFVVHKGDSRFTSISDHDLIVMSHSSAAYPKQSEQLQRIFWDLVVVDEAHSMKNDETLKHRLVRNLPKRNLLLLTATPLQNNLKELYNLVDLLHPGHLGTWKEFEDRYTLGRDSKKVNPIFRVELQKALSELIIRTTRDEVRRYIKFTDRIPHTKIIEPDHNEARLYHGITNVIRQLYSGNYNTLALMMYQRLASSSTNSSKTALYRMKINKIITESQYDEVMAIANKIPMDSKLSHLLDIVDKADSKFLIFTEFYATQDYIADALKGRGHPEILFNGRMNSVEKHDAVAGFRKDIEIMISTSAGGEGQNFQFCHNVINYDLPWNPMRVEQRIGRVHRIGQVRNVNIFNFALRGTIEAYILELLFMKIKLFQMTLGDMDLLFEDSWGAGSPQTWFKEYMDADNDEDEIRNQFSSLGDDWNTRKKTVGTAIKSFNEEVFANFDLSALGKKDESG